MSNVHPVVRPGHVAFHVGLIRRCPSQCPADVRRVQIEVGKADIRDLVNSRTKLRNLMKSGDKTCLDIVQPFNCVFLQRSQSKTGAKLSSTARDTGVLCSVSVDVVNTA